ncbi:MAG TPA: DUF3343 domain-containing protein [Bacillota bacterium]|jgi:hypothetical protein|nr:DUF3343 domain-containing protein [Fastidiosipila sp.]HPX92605.1 DUF3343 domain-containing protein [Bacillota bacterium]HQB81127.1 DUF3343 domain-containing protein [Bacillota bacterium]
MEYLIAFTSTSQAIRAERLLMDAKLKIRVMPLPGQINVGCGICLRVEAEELEEALRILQSRLIGGIEVYQKTLEGKRIIYLPHPITTQEDESTG